MNLAILTPAYNRADLLERVYKSLCDQTDKKFVWYVIDDGSSDNTEEKISSFIKQNKIDIRYFYKKNGGKHTALNFGISKINEKFLFILDSDDYLKNNAVETINKDVVLILDDNDICGIGYLRITDKDETIGKNYTKNFICDTFVNERYNKNIYGDKCEVFKTDILKQFPFPQFENEKFLSEATVWCKMSGKFKMHFYNKGFYVCEYQQGGLSDSIHKRLFLNPRGSKECYKVLCGKEFNFKNKLKNTLLYIVYSLACGEKFKKIKSDCPNKLLCFILFPFGKILYKRNIKNFRNKKK